MFSDRIKDSSIIVELGRKQYREFFQGLVRLIKQFNAYSGSEEKLLLRFYEDGSGELSTEWRRCDGHTHLKFRDIEELLDYLERWSPELWQGAPENETTL